jgi:hypothetical protein
MKALRWLLLVLAVAVLIVQFIRPEKNISFDEYASYRLMKQYHRFNDIIEQVQEDKMPLPSYLIIHGYARLSAKEKNELVQWCTAMRDSMKAKFPVDSLERRPRKQGA